MGFLFWSGNQEIVMKSQSSIRWLILAISSIMMFGDYYCFDLPAALKSQMDDDFNNPSNFESQYALLYTVYSTPNIILPFFSGYFIDKYGTCTMLIVFAFFDLLGQVIFSIGVGAHNWNIMYLGRLIFGFGGFSLSLGTTALCVDWFIGKELAFSLGFSLSMCRMGSVFNNFVSPRVCNTYGIETSMWIGTLLATLSFICAVSMYPIEKHVHNMIIRNQIGPECEAVVPLLGEKTDRDDCITDNKDECREHEGAQQTAGDVDVNTACINTKQQDSGDGMEDILMVADLEQREVQEGSFIRVLLNFPKTFWITAMLSMVVYGCIVPFNNVASTLLLERNYFMEQPNSLCALEDSSVGACQLNGNDPNEYCNNGQYYQPPLADGAEVDCENDSDDCYKVYCDGQSDAEVQATSIMSIPYIMAVLFCPIFGYILDEIGYMALVCGIVSPAILVIVHAVLGYTTVNPIYPLVGQGLAYALFASAFWPMAPMVIDSAYIGVAYGILFASQSLSLASLPPLIAWLYTMSKDHYIPNIELFLLCTALLGLLCGIYVNWYDHSHGGVLNSVIKTNDVGGTDDIGKETEGLDSNPSYRLSERTKSLSTGSVAEKKRQISNSSTVITAASFY